MEEESVIPSYIYSLTTYELTMFKGNISMAMHP